MDESNVNTLVVPVTRNLSANVGVVAADMRDWMEGPTLDCVEKWLVFDSFTELLLFEQSGGYALVHQYTCHTRSLRSVWLCCGTRCGTVYVNPISFSNRLYTMINGNGGDFGVAHKN